MKKILKANSLDMENLNVVCDCEFEYDVSEKL